MKSFTRFTKPLLLAVALCLAPIVGAQDSKLCAWPGNAAEGLLCLVDQNTPLLPNGTTKDDPARICSHGPGGMPFPDGCRALWYDAPLGGELLPVPWKEHDLPNFLAFLDKLASESGDKSGWCLADALPAHKVEVGERETTDEHGRKSRHVTYSCEGEARSCKTVPNPECELGQQWTVHECDADHYLPDPSTVAEGERFTQKNGCGDPKEAIGTKKIQQYRWVLVSSTVSRHKPSGAVRATEGSECGTLGDRGYSEVWRTTGIRASKRACEAGNRDASSPLGEGCRVGTRRVFDGYLSLACGGITSQISQLPTARPIQTCPNYIRLPPWVCKR